LEKNAVINALHRMMDYRLFESPDWITSRETYPILNKALYEMGVWESDRNDPKALLNTPLGNELEMDLLTAFLGMHYWPEVPMILQIYGLISSEKEAAIYRKWPDDRPGWEKLLRPIVKQAYLDFFNPKKALH
jgi:hypothetical protein